MARHAATHLEQDVCLAAQRQLSACVLGVDDAVAQLREQHRPAIASQPDTSMHAPPPPHTHTSARAPTQTQTHTHIHTCINTHAGIHTHSQTQTQTETETETETETDRQTHTHTHANACVHACRHTFTVWASPSAAILPAVGLFAELVGRKTPPTVLASSLSTLTNTRSPTGLTPVNCTRPHQISTQAHMKRQGERVGEWGGIMPSMAGNQEQLSLLLPSPTSCNG